MGVHTRCVLAKICNKALGPPLGNLRPELWVKVRVPLDADRLQHMEGAQLKGQVPEAVVEEEEVSQVCAHAQLGGQLGEVVVRGVEVGEVAQAADGGREVSELVGGNVELA